MNWQKYSYLIMTLDPVHIGTGGYRLGRVDNAIIREPGTNIPKIPGTSLHGAIRSAAAMRYGKPSAAGQFPKGRPEECPIVYTFGGGEISGFSSGVVSISDARIVFFPLFSIDGPIWITTRSILQEAEFSMNGTGVPEVSTEENIILSSGLKSVNNAFTLGWLVLNVQDNSLNLDHNHWKNIPELDDALKRIVIVHESLFSHIVNSNLETRTSVAINPETGAAEDGALYTYEAIPRAAFLMFNVIVDDYRTGKKPWPIDKKGNQEGKDGDLLGETWNNSIDVVNSGLRSLEFLGIGGMVTRGFGRIKTITISM
jgi:CRISPR-associated protein Cmr4